MPRAGRPSCKPYDNWVDFAANLKNPASIVNFIAAYGTHDDDLAARPRWRTSGRRRSSSCSAATGADGDADRAHGIPDRHRRLGWRRRPVSTRSTSGSAAWPRRSMPFGGMLGSTFNAIFEAQLENLQDGDRFYYLTRTQGQNFLNDAGAELVRQDDHGEHRSGRARRRRHPRHRRRHGSAPYRRRFLRRLRLRARSQRGQSGRLQRRCARQ